MSTFVELVSAAGLPGAWGTVRVSRPGSKPDPFNPARTLPDWGAADSREVRGFIATSPTSVTPDGAREQASTTSVLTCPDPGADVRAGDRVEAVPPDGRTWAVVGFTRSDANPFTGARPTLEADLEEVVG